MIVDIYIPFGGRYGPLEKALLKMFSRARIHSSWPGRNELLTHKEWYLVLPTPRLLWGKGKRYVKEAWFNLLKEKLALFPKGHIAHRFILLATEEEAFAPGKTLAEFLEPFIDLGIKFHKPQLYRTTRTHGEYPLASGKGKVKIVASGLSPRAETKEKWSLRFPEPQEIYKAIWDVLIPHRHLSLIAPLPESHIAVLLASGYIPPGIRVLHEGREVEVFSRTTKRIITSPPYSYVAKRDGEEVFVQEVRKREAYGLEIFVKEGSKTHRAFPKEE